MRLNARVDRLEAKQPSAPLGNMFLWPEGQGVHQALAAAGLSLDDKPLFAIELVGIGGLCPIHEREAHLLD